MPKQSAGILLYRIKENGLQVLLVHPGGPFWKNKDAGAWSIPKGEPAPGEDLLATAQREFTEELGFDAPGPFTPLTAIKQKGGKIVHAWACKGDCDTAKCTSNTFEVTWPPGSDKKALFAEIDKVEFFDLPVAREKINPAQVALLDQLERLSHQTPEPHADIPEGSSRL